MDIKTALHDKHLSDAKLKTCTGIAFTLELRKNRELQSFLLNPFRTTYSATDDSVGDSPRSTIKYLQQYVKKGPDELRKTLDAFKKSGPVPLPQQTNELIAAFAPIALSNVNTFYNKPINKGFPLTKGDLLNEVLAAIGGVLSNQRFNPAVSSLKTYLTTITKNTLNSIAYKERTKDRAPHILAWKCSSCGNKIANLPQHYVDNPDTETSMIMCPHCGTVADPETLSETFFPIPGGVDSFADTAPGGSDGSDSYGDSQDEKDFSSADITKDPASQKKFFDSIWQEKFEKALKALRGLAYKYDNQHPDDPFPMVEVFQLLYEREEIRGNKEETDPEITYAYIAQALGVKHDYTICGNPNGRHITDTNRVPFKQYATNPDGSRKIYKYNLSGDPIYVTETVPAACNAMLANGSLCGNTDLSALAAAQSNQQAGKALADKLVKFFNEDKKALELQAELKGILAEKEDIK